MARRFANVSEEKIVAINDAACFYPSDLVNTKTTIPLIVGEERWIYTYDASFLGIYPPPPLRGIVVHYSLLDESIIRDPTKKRSI